MRDGGRNLFGARASVAGGPGRGEVTPCGYTSGGASEPVPTTGARGGGSSTEPPPPAHSKVVHHPRTAATTMENAHRRRRFLRGVWPACDVGDLNSCRGGLTASVAICACSLRAGNAGVSTSACGMSETLGCSVMLSTAAGSSVVFATEFTSKTLTASRAPNPQRSRACRIARALCQRFDRAGSSARSITSMSSRGSEQRDSAADGARSVAIRFRSSKCEEAMKGGRPTNARYKVAPTAHRSARASTALPRACSGLMKQSVPMIAPGRVTGHASPVSLLEAPKSKSLVTSDPASVRCTKMLLGLISR